MSPREESPTSPAHAAIALVTAFVAVYGLTPLTRVAARRLGILDHPLHVAGSHKRHAQAIPYLGGLAIVAGTGIGVALLTAPGSGSDVRIARVAVVGIAALWLALVGLLDDIQALPRMLRLLVQIGAAGAAWIADFRVDTPLTNEIDLLITIVWVVGITNAFNLLDNMDGLSSGVAGIAALSFGVIGVTASLPEVTITSGALAGAAFGFLAHNRHPATVYMGDSGSLFLGYVLALVGIKLRFDNLIQATFLVPVVVLGLPIVDTTLVTLSRWRNGRPLFLGGRDHISHRLVAIGLPVKAAVRSLYVVAASLGWLGLVIAHAAVTTAWMLLGLVTALGVYLCSLLWPVSLDTVTEESPETDELVSQG